jgi:hypothetical protein
VSVHGQVVEHPARLIAERGVQDTSVARTARDIPDQDFVQQGLRVGAFYVERALVVDVVDTNAFPRRQMLLLDVGEDHGGIESDPVAQFGAGFDELVEVRRVPTSHPSVLLLSRASDA